MPIETRTASAEDAIPMKPAGQQERSQVQKKIWIDLDNSPHVPFFKPIIEELQNRGHQIFLTGRNSYQVCELVDLNRLPCKVIGGHWGKHKVLKMMGTCVRAARLVPIVLKAKPDLAVSHGSRAQLIVGSTLRIPTILMYDYEFTAGVGFFHPDWTFIPQCLPSPGNFETRNRLLKYPGLKEDVYVSRNRLDGSARGQLGLPPNDIVVTMRPPATEAHYHNAEGEVLFDAALKLLLHRPDVRIILLPRNDRQAKTLRQVWKEAITERRIVIPDHAVNGLDLIWSSDLVISGGGTMNREAAALGVPVYSIFRGRIGGVDKHLAATGRLVILESVKDVQTKIRVIRNDPATRHSIGPSPALQSIVEGIASIAEHQCLQNHQ